MFVFVAPVLQVKSTKKVRVISVVKKSTKEMVVRWGLVDIARHVIRCRLTQETRGAGGCCSPRRRVPLNSRDGGSWRILLATS